MYLYEAPGLAGERAPRTIEQVAARYADKLVELHPDGPVYLAGYSGGALFAIEMARVLRNRGRDVPLLMLVDPIHASLQRAYPPAPVRPWRRRGRFDSVRRAIRARPRLARALAASALNFGMRVPLFLRKEHYEGLFWRLVGRYDAPIYTGPTTMLYTADIADPLRGWGPLLPGLVEQHFIEGDHYDLLKDPHAPRLAELLERCIAGSS